MKVIELNYEDDNLVVKVLNLLEKEVITFDECQLMKKDNYHFLWKEFVNENISTYKVFYRNDYVKDINIDFTDAK